MQRYVVGFMFDFEKEYVLLIRKTKPEWQRGLLNGIGGKIEPGESALEAMRREFEEETGIYQLQWNQFCVLKDAKDEWQVHFFECIGPLELAKDTTEELPEICKVSELPSNVIPNLKWLIPMAANMEQESADGFTIKEQKLRRGSMFTSSIAREVK